eukprot:1140615-Pelagomonas_calceolata.AAC.1
MSLTRSKSPVLLNFRLINVHSSGCCSAANRTGAVATPLFRSFSAGLPKMDALPVRSSTSSTICVLREKEVVTRKYNAKNGLSDGKSKWRGHDASNPHFATFGKLAAFVPRGAVPRSTAREKIHSGI